MKSVGVSVRAERLMDTGPLNVLVNITYSEKGVIVKTKEEVS